MDESGEIKIPPVNKGNILNYNLNEELLREDGYLELITNSKPNDEKNYKSAYEERDGKIYQVFTEEIETYSELRIKEYPSVNDVIDAVCKALDGDRTEFDELQAYRMAIKQKYPKPTETSEQSEVSS